MRWKIALAAVIVISSVAAAAQNGSQFRDWRSSVLADRQQIKPRLACVDIAAMSGYEFSIATALVVPASQRTPEHCRISGLILPEIRFELNLPVEWNGRLYMFGNGGYAGEAFEAAVRVTRRDLALAQGFAVVATNTGHDAATEPLATFAVNYQKFVDYSSRAVHVTAMTAKRIAQSYYEQAPRRSYFDGCSTGGRQGLMSAQRFPADFDGILVGAPVLNLSGTNISNLWQARALAATPIAPAKMKIIASKVYEKCDRVDGLADGLIDDPRKCAFDPTVDLPKCAGDSDGPACFTTAQTLALRQIYSAVKSGSAEIFPGLPVGAEIEQSTPNGMVSGWHPWVVPLTGTSISLLFAETFMRYMAFGKADPNYDWTKFDFDRDPERIQATRRVLDATDPDLSRFKARGGKIVMYFGWADPALNPLMGLGYYEQVRQLQGPATDDFFKLYMVPGMFHCGGGVGTSTFDAFTPLVEWVENGTAPVRINAARVVENKILRTRPLCPFPEVAKYKGSGSIDEAENFSCARPRE